MTSYDYFKQQKEQQERQQFYNDIRLETELMIKSAIHQIKEEVITEIKQQIDIQIGLIMGGKKIDNIDIGEVVVAEVIRQINAKT